MRSPTTRPNFVRRRPHCMPVIYFTVFFLLAAPSVLARRFSTLDADPDSLLAGESNRESREIADAAAESEPLGLLICEGLIANLTCPPGHHIVVQLANFGRFSLQPCNPTKATDINTQCYNERTTDLLKQRCDGKQFCTVSAKIASFGGVDACPGSHKYLDATYACAIGDAATDEAEVLSTTTTTTTTVVPSSALSDIDRPLISYDENALSTQSNANVDLRSRHAYCASTLARGLQWPNTKGGHLARLPCPTDGGSHSEWMCSLDGSWTPADAPDMSRCSTQSLGALRKDVDVTGNNDGNLDANIMSNFHVMSSLSDYIQMRFGTLLGGELIDALHVLMQAAVQFEALNDRVDKQPERKTSEYHVNVVGGLLNERDAWRDVSPPERRRLADTLLQILPHVLSFDSVEHAKWSDRNGAVRVVQTRWPALKNSKTLAHFSFDEEDDLTVDVPYSAPSPTRAMLIDYDSSLGEQLSSRSPVDALLTQNDEVQDEEWRVVSRVATFFVVHKPPLNVSAPIPITITLRHYNNGNESVLRCLRWRPIALRWSTVGCATLEVNATHSRCECDAAAAIAGIAEHFAVALDVSELPNEPSGGWEDVFSGLIAATLSAGAFVASCTFALLAVALTLICFVAFDNTVAWSMHLCARRNFCTMLCACEALIIIMAFTPSLKLTSDWLEVALRCTVLAAVAWTLVDAYALAATAAQTCTQNVCTCYIYAFAYGVPLIFTALAVTFGRPADGDRTFIMFFLAPSAACLALAALCALYTVVGVLRTSYRTSGYAPCKKRQPASRRAENLYFGGTAGTIGSGTSTELQSLGVRWALKTSAATQLLLASAICAAVFWRVDVGGKPHKRVYAAAFAVVNCVLSAVVLFGYVLLDATMRQTYEKWSLSNGTSLFGQIYQRLSLSFAGSTTSSNTSTSVTISAPKTFAKIGGRGGLLLGDASPPSHFDYPLAATSTVTATTESTCCASSDLSDCSNCTHKIENSPVMCGNCWGGSLHYGQHIASCSGNHTYNNTRQNNHATVNAPDGFTPFASRHCRQPCGAGATQFCSTSSLQTTGGCCHHSVKIGCSHSNNNNNNNNGSCGFSSSFCIENGGLYDYATIPYGEVALPYAARRDHVTPNTSRYAGGSRHYGGSAAQPPQRSMFVETPRVPLLRSADSLDDSSDAVIRMRAEFAPPRFPPPLPPQSQQWTDQPVVVYSPPQDRYLSQGEVPPSSAPTSARSVVLRMDLRRNEPLFTEELHHQEQ